MSDELVLYDAPQLPQTAREVIDAKQRIAQIMQSVMVEGTHYGTIPGTPKPTLYQPGAEVLLVTFRLAAHHEVEDLSTDTEKRFRVRTEIREINTGRVFATGVGEASSSEEKYAWRAAVCDEEFNEADPSLRRKKWKKNGNNVETILQIHTNPSDSANTVLKMAVKRALIAGTRAATGCSDIFAQDLEDLGGELPEGVKRRSVEQPRAKAPAQPAAPKPATPKPAAAPAATAPAPEPAAAPPPAAAPEREPGADDDAAPQGRIPPEAWEPIRKAWHTKGTINEKQLKLLFFRAGTNGWSHDAMKSEVSIALDLDLEQIAYGDPFNLMLELFEKKHAGPGK